MFIKLLCIASLTMFIHREARSGVDEIDPRAVRNSKIPPLNDE